MANEEVINQHYVPQAYLRRFANSSGQIWVFDKATSREFQTNVRNVGSERRFYDSEDLKKITGDRQFIEKHLSNLEGVYENRIRSLIDSLSTGKFKEIKSRDRHFLSAYMVVQMIRTKETRIMHQQMAEALLAIQKQGYRNSASEIPPDAELLDGMTVEEMARDVHNRSLLRAESIQQMASILFHHIWVVQESFEKEVFLTSDHPFGKRGHITNTWRSMNGIASKGIEIVFPLSPRYLLTLMERTHFAKAQALDGRKVRLTSHDNMIYCNQFQIKQSNRFIFSRENDFDFAKTVIRDEPTHGDPDRKRVEVN
jgi:hypothetical protein